MVGFLEWYGFLVGAKEWPAKGGWLSYGCIGALARNCNEWGRSSKFGVVVVCGVWCVGMCVC